MYLKIYNKDRIGLILDVSDILTKQNINIVSMEVQPNIIYLELKLLNSNQYTDIRSQLQTIPHVQEVQVISPFSYEVSSVQNATELAYDDQTAFDAIFYCSEQMKHIVSLAKKIAKTHSTVLLRGESGTGKELFAKAIHRASMRFDKPFIALNCAAVPETLLESELFGYEDGAFTGAKRAGKKGIFEHANGGTVFLDEIGELPFHLQAKLLRVLQEGTIKRVGCNDEIKIDVRIIAATNRNLEEMMKQQIFREDLYYRLNILPLWIPPLRERQEDLPLLIMKLLHKKCQQLCCSLKKLTPSAMEKLLQHNWPGNIRELENVLERGICFSSQSTITAADIVLDPAQNPLNKTITAISSAPKKLKQYLDELEFELLSQAIEKYGTSRQVGKVLGLSHTGVLNRMKKHALLKT